MLRASNLYNDSKKEYTAEYVARRNLFLQKMLEFRSKKSKSFWSNERTKLTIMNKRDQLVLYTDASTKAMAGVLMQVQAGIEKPCIFVSHAVSEQASKWGLMELELELELYAFIYCVKHLSPCWENNLSCAS